MANKIVQLFLDFVSRVSQIDSKGWLAKVSLLLHLDFEVTRLNILGTYIARQISPTSIVLTFELVNFVLL